MISPSSGIFSPDAPARSALAHLLDGQVHGLAVAHDAGGARLQADQALDGRAGGPWRASSMRPSRISVTMTAAASK